MILLEVEQGTMEWHEARLGIPTASRFRSFFTSTGKPSASAQTYIYELVEERFLGFSDEQFESAWMGRGTRMEDEAIDAYNFIRDLEVERVGFCYLDERKHVGCSPDGFVGEDGGVEIKCPKAKNHIKYLLDDKVPADYYAQVQGTLWITGRKWWDFISYYPGLPIFIYRAERDEEYIEKLSEAVLKAADEVIELEKAVREKGGNP